MMRWIVGKSLKARRMMVALAAVLIVVGLTQLRSMPVDVLPEFQPPTVQVQTEALGLSATEVEEFITVPLEQDLLNGVAFLQEIRSASLPGLSSIEMVFEPGTDLLHARQVVQERLSQAQTALPNVQTRPAQMLQPLSSTSRIMLIALSSDEIATDQMSILTRYTIGPRLLGVPGVANVAVWGFRDQQLQVLVDPERLRQQGVSLQQVIDTAANSQFVCPLTFEECSTPGTGGIIETANQRVGVQYIPVTATPEDLARVPIQDVTGPPLRLGDVAEVTQDHQLLIGDAVGPDLMLVVQKFPEANTAEVTTGLENALDALAPGLAGIQIDTSIYRPATYIETSTNNLSIALLIGGILAILALVGLMFDWRGALTSVVSILAAIGAAGLVLSLSGATLNTMSIAGLVMALVVIIDDAVIDVDSYARRIRERQASGEGPSVARTFLGAALEMRSAAAYALLIALVSIVPADFASGTFGTFLPPIATTYGLAVAVSMLVALIVTPAVGLMLMSGGKERSESPIVRSLGSRFAEGVSRFMRSPIPVAVTVGVLVVAALASLPFLSSTTVPSFKDTNLLVHLGGAPSTSLAEMQRVSALVADELRSTPGVATVGAHVGRAVTSDEAVGTNAGQLWITVDPEADYDTTVSAVQDTVGAYPGVTSDVVTYPNARIDEILPDAGAPVSVRVYGQDYGVLRTEAEDVQAMLAGVDGVVDPQVVLPIEEPTLEIQVDLERAEEHGIRPGDVRRAASTLISGITVGSLFEDQKVFEVVVWGAPEIRNNLTAVNQLLIDGDQIRLGDVADVRIAPAPTAIRHDAVSRYADVVADASGRDLGAVLADVDAGLKQMAFPLEYHAEVQGDLAQTQDTNQRVLGLVIAAAVLIFLLLQVALGSWRRATLAFLMLPLALTGCMTAAVIGGGTVSLGTIAGVLAVLTIAARQVLVLMNRYRHLGRDEQMEFGDELVVRGARERFAPLLTTFVTGVLLMAPLVLAGDIAGLEIVHPMAVAIVGGLITATVVNMFVLPGLYRRFGNVAETAMTDVSLDRLIDLTEQESMERIGGGT